MRLNDAIIGLIAIVVGIGVLVHVQTFPLQEGGRPGPSLFPSVLAGLFMIAGVYLFITGRRECKDEPWCTKLPGLNARGIGNIIITLLAIVFYILVSETLGFLLTSFIIMVGLMIMLKAKIKYAIPVAVVMTVFAYLVFHKGLLVPLPRGYLYF